MVAYITFVNSHIRFFRKAVVSTKETKHELNILITISLYISISLSMLNTII